MLLVLSLMHLVELYFMSFLIQFRFSFFKASNPGDFPFFALDSQQLPGFSRKSILLTAQVEKLSYLCEL
ncbi:hypothetical protein FGO68_gene17148 [Halteria grandinella]|uniref:Uncharacterized protein n=1 Tax=Halteria grandinella TaxID=5974 RepID=A0A8J8T8Q0_HALGN|nr:hypothetical protein FGO68_gene17148 [Halteria grandinella]